MFKGEDISSHRVETFTEAEAIMKLIEEKARQEKREQEQVLATKPSLGAAIVQQDSAITIETPQQPTEELAVGEDLKAEEPQDVTAPQEDAPEEPGKEPVELPFTIKVLEVPEDFSKARLEEMEELARRQREEFFKLVRRQDEKREMVYAQRLQEIQMKVHREREQFEQEHEKTQANETRISMLKNDLAL
ncbi:MAG: hypothetical protein SGCHY_002714 [Lobulomycetales sp.]